MTRASSTAAEVVLETRGIVKRFGGITALDGVSFELKQGEIHALCGENGAGKSTLIKVLTGIHPHGTYEGEVHVQGQVARFTSTRDAEAAGLAVIYQELALVPEMTVAENLFLGREPRRFGFIDWDRLYDDAARWLREVGMDLEPSARVAELGVGRQQLVEIARAVAKRSRILVLDEPTAALTGHEIARLLELLRELRAKGISCIYISHKLDEVFALADRITVLRDGRTVGTSPAHELDAHALIRRMVGREIADLYPRREVELGAVLLEVKDLTVAETPAGRPRLQDISFTVRAGEVLGIGGLMGAGRTELMRSLVGCFGHREHGQVRLRGVELDARDPARAMAQGLVLVTEDRKRYGLVLDQSIGFNLSLSNLGRLHRLGLLDLEREVTASRAQFAALAIRAPGLETVVGELSGGNQQKVVLGKALLTEPSVILLDEPTRGIDVGAKVEVYELINQLKVAGKAVVLVSSELGELIGMSDRIVMMREGRVSGVIPRAEATQERLLAAALGKAEAA